MACALAWGVVLALALWGGVWRPWPHGAAGVPRAPAQAPICRNAAGQNVLGTPWPMCQQTATP